jgi:hypothetical protein
VLIPIVKVTLYFLFIFSLLVLTGSLKIKQIDFTESGINTSTLPVQRDTIIYNNPRPSDDTE